MLFIFYHNFLKGIQVEDKTLYSQMTLIMDVEIPKQCIKKLPELIIEFSKVTGYKVYILETNKWKLKFFKHLLQQHQKNMLCLGVTLTKHVQDLYSESS